jgi:hypothetical protein
MDGPSFDARSRFRRSPARRGPPTKLIIVVLVQVAREFDPGIRHLTLSCHIHVSTIDIDNC